jgi:hypothetical protein
MAVERASNGYETPVKPLESKSQDEPSLTDDDVLAFLSDLRTDRQRCHSLNYGRKLLHEAAETGLVEENRFDQFIAQMLELRANGLAGWTPATHDRDGDDLLYAAEFHLTLQGRSRLRAAEGDR